jgi:hypothetical protein
MLQNRYPQCLLTANNILQINLIITTFGGYKDYYNENKPKILVDENESLPLNLYLLYKTISTTQDTAIYNLSSILSGNTELYKEEIPISTYTNALTGFINKISGRIFYSFKYYNWRY